MTVNKFRAFVAILMMRLCFYNQDQRYVARAISYGSTCRGLSSGLVLSNLESGTLPDADFTLRTSTVVFPILKPVSINPS